MKKYVPLIALGLLLLAWVGWQVGLSEPEAVSPARKPAKASQSALLVSADASIELTRALDREQLALVTQKLWHFGAVEGPLKPRLKAPSFVGAHTQTDLAILQRRQGTWHDKEGQQLLAAALDALRKTTVELRAPSVALPLGADAGVAANDQRWFGDGDRLVLIAADRREGAPGNQWLQPLQAFNQLVVHPVGSEGMIQLTAVTVRHAALNFLRPDTVLAPLRHPTGGWRLQVAGAMTADDLASLALPKGWRLKFLK